MSLAHARRKGADPDKALPEGWNRIDKRTGEPQGIGKGWGYAPGGTVVDAVQALAPKLEALPAEISVGAIQSWLTETLFGRWMQKPDGDWPLARLSGAQSDALGAQGAVAHISPETMAKQLRVHPDLTIFDYAQAPIVVRDATEVIQDTPDTMVFIHAPEGFGGHVLVVKATRIGRRLYVTSFRRLSGSEDEKRRTVERLRRRNIRE